MCSTAFKNECEAEPLSALQKRPCIHQILSYIFLQSKVFWQACKKLHQKDVGHLLYVCFLLETMQPDLSTTTVRRGSMLTSEYSDAKIHERRQLHAVITMAD